MHHPTDRIAHTTSWGTGWTTNGKINHFIMFKNCFISFVIKLKSGIKGNLVLLSACLKCGQSVIASQQGISRSSQCSTTGITKAVVCVILSV